MTSAPLSRPLAPRRVPRRRWARLGAVALSLGLALGLSGAVVPAAAATPTVSAPTPEPPTVLVGVAGLRWADVDATTMPTLWGMIGSGSVASIAGRLGGQVTCPRDAWAALSAGRELPANESPFIEQVDTTAPDAAATGEPSQASEPNCAPMPTVDSTSVDIGPATVTGWYTPAEEAPSAAVPSTEGLPGTLAAALATAGTCTTAINPGAAVMLADRAGQVDRYARGLNGLTADDLTACPIVVMDAGVLPDGTADRKKARQSLDRDLATLRELLPRGSRILVAGVVDTVPARPELQVVVDWRSRGGAPHWLTSTSTRRQGVAQLLDLTHTVAAAGNADTKAIGGAPLVDGELRRMGVARTVENLRYLTVLDETITTVMPALLGAIALALVCGIGGLLLTRRSALRRGESAGPSPRTRRILAAVLLLAAAAPVAASLGALSRWWVSPAPTLVLAVSVSVATAAAAIASWWISRALPRSPLALAATISALTWVTLTVDGLTGTVLQQGSIFGSSPALGARFYGFNNMTFAVYATAALVFAGALASFLPRGRIAAIAGIAVVTVVVDGWPQFGADFGGVFALVPAFAVLGLLATRTRVSMRRVAAVVGATVLVVAVVAVADWLAPGTPSHVGALVERAIQGQGLEVIERKAAGAWATVANPAGVVVLLAVLTAGYGVLRPRRCGLPAVADAYDTVPLLRPITVSLVVAASIGSVLNDSGIIIAVMFVLVGAATLLGSFLAEPAPATPRALLRPPMTPTLLAAGGGLLVVLLLASGVLTSPSLRPADQSATAGEESHATRGDVLSADAGIVVIGTTGVTWDDVTARAMPSLTAMLTDGAAAGGVAQPTGAASVCAVGGWLALSAGQLATVTTTRDAEGYWECPVPTPIPAADGGATLPGWTELVDLQQGSAYQAELGVLGEQLRAATCTTAVGPGAALALARPDGTVGRYRTLQEALAPTSDAFTCPVTLVDAGDATAPRIDPDLPAAERALLRSTQRADRLAGVDRSISHILDATPAGTAVVVVDVARTPGTRPVLGVVLARPGDGGPTQARFLTSSATRSDGIARALDIPATLLGAAGLTVSEPLQDTPLAYGSLRPSEAVATARALAELTARDQVRRDAYVYFVDVPLYAGLILAGLCLIVSRVRGLRPRWRKRLGSGARGAALFLAAWPAAAFLVSLTGWWRFDNPGLALGVSAVGSALAVAGVAALAPRKPLWLAPGIIAGITFLVLTIDGLVGTPLNRASPLGSAPTFGARFYGFGNPTFSVYAVAALILAAALAQWLIRRGQRWWAVTAVTAIGLVTMAVDVWPTLGADLGGGLVLVPGFAVLGISASGSRVTWRRVLLVGAAGVGAVAAVGVLDWLRPVQARSHLGRFVGQVIEGDAFGTVLRKAGYALRSVLGGTPVWLTIVVIVASAVVLFVPRRFTPHWWARAQTAWPLVRPATVGLWIVLVTGSLVNDFGVRIAMIALIPAVPLYTVIGLSVLGDRDDTSVGAPADPDLRDREAPSH